MGYKMKRYTTWVENNIQPKQSREMDFTNQFYATVAIDMVLLIGMSQAGGYYSVVRFHTLFKILALDVV